MTPEPTALPDGFTMNPDGTISVPIDGREIRLRRPKIGELRRLRHARDRALDEVNEIRDELARRGDEINAAARARPDVRTTGDGRPVLNAEEREAQRVAVARAEERQLDLVIGWLRLTFNGGGIDGEEIRGLGSGPLPDDVDEWPSWFADLRWEPARQLLEQWTFAPPPHGAV